MDAGHRGPLPGAAAGGPRRHRRRRPGAGGGPRPPPAPGDAVRAWPDPARHGAGAAPGQAQAGRQAAPATGPGDFRVPPGPPVGGTGSLGALPHRAPPACPARADRHRGTRRRPGRIRPHQPAGRPGPVPQPPHGGGQPRPGLPQAGGILTGRTRRSHGPQRARAAPALTARPGDQDGYPGGWPAEAVSSGQNSASPVRPRRRFAAPTAQNTTPSRTITPNTPRVTDSKNTRDTPELLLIE